MGDENEEFSLFGNFDMGDMVKKFIKKNMALIMIVILLCILGSYFYMLSLGYGLMRIMFVYVAVGFVTLFLMKTIKKMMDDMKISKEAKKPNSMSEDNLIKQRTKHQSEINDIDKILEAREMELKDEAKRIKAAREGKVIKEKK